MFKIDLHVHTVLGGDSLITLEELVPACLRAGLDAVCITEHHSYGLSQPVEELSGQTGFPIFRGLEYRADVGHLLIYGVNAGKAELPPRLPMQYAIDWVVSRGGVAVPAHPYQRDMMGARLGDDVFKLNNLVALETMNASAGEEENEMAHDTAKQMGLYNIGGSDAHGARVLGRAYTVFDTDVTTDEELILALKSGKYRTENNQAAEKLSTIPAVDRL